MADKATLLAEAYRRGLLTGEKKTAYEEALRRGIVKAPTKRNGWGRAADVVANLNATVPLADEFAAGVDTAVNFLSGKPADIRQSMAKQRQMERSGMENDRTASNLARGTGLAATMVVPGAQVAKSARAANVLRGATAGAAEGAVYGATGEGDLRERLGAANTGAALGGVVGSAGGLLAPAMKRAPKPNVLAQTVEEFDRVGVRPMLATTSEGASRVAKAVGENPLAGVRVRKSLRDAVGDVAGAAERAATRYGAPSERAAAGETVQEGIGTFSKRFSERAARMYDNAFQPIEMAEARAVEKNAQAFEAANKEADEAFEAAKSRSAEDYSRATTDYRRAADLRSARGGATVAPEPVPPPTEVSRLAPPPQRQAIAPSSTITALREIDGRVNAEKLSNIITDGRIRSIASALESDAHNVRFGDLRALRTWVREAQGNEVLRQGLTRSGLQRLEAALTDDIYRSAEALGGNAASRRLRQADQFYRLGNQRIKGQLQQFVGKSAPKAGESAYDLVVRAASDVGGADTARLIALKKSLKSAEWDDVAATVVSRLGKPTPGAADQGPFSVAQFVTNYAKLSPRGRSLLFGTGEKRAELEALASVAGKMKGVERASNASNSASAMQSLGTVAGLANPGTAIPTATGLGGLALTGEALTNPATIRYLATRASKRELEAARDRLLPMAQKSPAAEKLLAQVVRRLGVSASIQVQQPAPNILATGTR